jgi:hypothetical protein
MDSAFITWARQAIADMDLRATMLDGRRITTSQIQDGQIIDTTAEDAADLRRKAVELERLIAGQGDTRRILPPGHN